MPRPAVSVPEYRPENTQTEYDHGQDDDGEELASKTRRTGRRVGGVVLALTLVVVGGIGAAGYDGLTNEGRGINKVLARIFHTQTGSAAAAEKKPTPSVTETPTATTTTPPARKTTKPTPKPSATASKPKAVVPPVAAKPSGEQCVAALPLGFKLGQKIGIPAYGDKLIGLDETVRKDYVGTVVLMTQPASMVDKNYLALTDNKNFPVPLNVATDEEGGTVQRVVEPGQPKLPSAAAVAKMSPTQLEAFKKSLTANYTYLKKNGINTIFAPVMDVAPVTGVSKIDYPSKTPQRTFSNNPNVVAKYDKMYVDIAKKVGLHVVEKHFPGGGSMSELTDLKAATIPSLEQLMARDLVPYALTKADGANVMVGSMVPQPSKADVNGWTDGKPADLSPVVYQLARSAFGFSKAVIYTDDLGTKAINKPLSQAFVEAWAAGADVPIFVKDANAKTPQTLEQQIAAIVTAGQAGLKNGTLKIEDINASVQRILADKGIADSCVVLKKVDNQSYLALEKTVAKTAATKAASHPTSPAPTTSALTQKSATTSKQQVIVKQTASVVATSK
jgi:beta-N-acetylhexosaminidase